MFVSLVVSCLSGREVVVAAALSVAEGVEVGGPIHGRLPVVVEAQSRGELDAQLDTISELPGVATVELVFFDFSSQHEDRTP